MQSRRARYLAAAEDCIRLAGQVFDPNRKLSLIDLASTWMRLAQQADKGDQSDVVYGPPPPPDKDTQAPTSH